MDKNRLANALRRAYKKFERDEWISGKLGKLNSDGTYTYSVAGRPGFVHVTIRNANGAQTVVAARNDASVEQTPRLSVKMKLEYGVYVIYGRDGRADLGNNPVPPIYGVINHAPSHQNGGDDEIATLTPAAGAIPKADANSLLDDWVSSVAEQTVAAANKATPIDTDSLPLVDSAAANVLKELTWENVKITLKAYFDTLYGLLAAVNTWTRQQFIDGSSDEVQLRVQTHSSQTTNVQTWENSSASVLSWLDSAFRFRGTAGMYVKNGYYALPSENALDSGMTGLYDRNEITNAALRGVVTVTITGAGSYTNTVAEKNKLFDSAAGNYFEITGTDGTTTQVVIHIDLLANQPNYNSALWQPFVQYRLLMGPGFSGTYFNSIVVECSADNATWYKPSGGEWETSDAASEELVAGYWIGESGSIGAVGLTAWRYVRFTLTDREENAGYAFKASIWIAEIGLRHRNSPWTRHYLPMSGGDVHGDVTLTTDGVAASSYNTKIQQNGGAVFNEQGADVDVRIEGDTDPNLFFADASADAVGFGTNTPAAKQDIVQLTLGNAVQKLSSIATNDDPTEIVYQQRVTTTNNTVTTLWSHTVPASTTIGIKAFVVARRTGGSAGVAEDGAFYELTQAVKNVAGTATIIGSGDPAPTAAEDQVGWAAVIDVTGATVRIRVTGATNNNITWHCTVRLFSVGS